MNVFAEGEEWFKGKGYYTITYNDVDDYMDAYDDSLLTYAKFKPNTSSAYMNFHFVVPVSLSSIKVRTLENYGVALRAFDSDDDLLYFTTFSSTGLKDVDLVNVKRVIVYKLGSINPSYLYNIDFYGTVLVPTVMNINPSDNLQGVLVDSNINIEFSKDILEDSLDNVFLYDSNMNPVSVEKSVVSNILTLNPVEDLKFAENYIISVSGVKALDGTPMIGTKVSEFMTELPGMGDLSLVYNASVKKISLSWNDLQADEYQVYLNNNLIETVNDTSYIIDGLSSNTLYEVKVVAKKAGYKDSVIQESVTTLNYFSQYPSSEVGDVGYNYAVVSWDTVLDAVGYEVKLGEMGEVQYLNSDVLKYRFDGLTELTDYVVYIRSIFESDVSDWNTVNFTTLAEPEVPPPKPENLFLIEKGLDYITVEVSDTVYSDGYNFYLNNVKVHSQLERVYTYSLLEPGTTYSLAVKSYNSYGESRMSAGLIIRTDEEPIPRVTNATSSWVDDGGSATPLKQKVSWQSENVVDGFKLLVDGVEVETYSADKSEAVIDFELLGLEPGLHDIEILPIGGQPYKLVVNTQSSGNEDMDKVLGSVQKGTNVIKTAGLYLLFGLVSFCILIFSITWLFNKWKLGLVTRNPDQIEADPDVVLKTDLVDKGDGVPNNPIDVQAYRNAKSVEKEYKQQKSNSKQYKKSEKELKQKGNSFLSFIKEMANPKLGKKVKGKQRPRRHYYYDARGNKYQTSNTEEFLKMKARDYKEAKSSGNWEKFAQKYNSQSVYKRIEQEKFKKYLKSEKA